ncbi:PLP-dependent aminotransferase family protein [Gluconacetobacter azotocaptans]|uniref:aminotransferase-like domain-containing protein n=1 Tax=Gluconacetobacter azotocaptans TaxID=142834 RepID=UPI00195AD759|nr:PLP-dependent aminotransferase family protein [Gluconacetobacter azotocaptans]MBM9401492.1 PLP-dependent aminotransferase family protein [Gluconacetobacter azotocaptans]
MRLQSPWQPRLADGPAAPSERLATALADDILSARLPTGARLPAHRDLAWRIGIGVGTVTKAYGMLERRGLVRSVRGRGTFVAAVPGRQGPVIDLSVNMPPAMISERALARTLARISRSIDPDLFNIYPPVAGHDEHRRMMARWLSGLGMDAAPDRLLLTNGAQQALAVAMAVASPPGGTIVTEACAYPGALALARQTGRAVAGVEMDAQGMRPDALDRVLAGRREAPMALYVTPTMHNPTTATMDARRRRDIVALCRRHDVAIIEDDVYACTEPDADPQPLPPLAMLAPERTFYVNSLSKTLSPGLRIGALVVPPAHLDAAESVLLTTSLMIAPLSYAVMAQWMLDGTALAVRAAIRTEATQRRDLAASLLGPAMTYPRYDGFHVWLPMARPDAERLAELAAAEGIAVTAPGLVSVAPDAPMTGIRLCLGRARLPDLIRALETIGRHMGRAGVPDPKPAHAAIASAPAGE